MLSVNHSWIDALEEAALLPYSASWSLDPYPITIIDTNGYRHFVVIKGINDDEVLVGDPALGAKIYRRADFEAIWAGLIFVIRDKVDVGRNHFNAKSEWRVRENAPFGTALTRANLGIFTLLLPAGNEF